MKLQKGSLAKSFEMEDIYGNLVRLEDLRGKKILLSFFRNVICPFCNLRVYQLSKLQPEWEEQLQIVALFESPTRIILKSSFHAGLSPIPVISDPEKKIYAAYGVEISALKTAGSIFHKKFYTLAKPAREANIDISHLKKEEKNSKIIPADFLIDENFVIQEAYYGNSVADHIPMERIREFAQPKPSENRPVL